MACGSVEFFSDHTDIGEPTDHGKIGTGSSYDNGNERSWALQRAHVDPASPCAYTSTGAYLSRRGLAYLFYRGDWRLFELGVGLAAVL